MKAKAVNDGVCPRCGGGALKTTVLPDGATRHECPVSSCAYLMVWKPTEAEVSPNEPN